MYLSGSALLLASIATLGSTTLPLDIATPKGFTKLRTWERSSLYRVEADTNYGYAPLLVHLTGSRYREFVALPHWRIINEPSVSKAECSIYARLKTM